MSNKSNKQHKAKKQVAHAQMASQNQTRVDDLKRSLAEMVNRLATVEKSVVGITKGPPGGPLIDGYLKVDQKDGKLSVNEVAKPLPSPKDVSHPDLKVLLHKIGGRLGRPRLNNVVTKIAVSSTINGSSGTAISTVINVRPSAYSEFASWAALFDEFKVHGGSLFFNYWATGQTNLVVGNDAAIGYDPVDNAAYASVAGVLVSSQHVGPICGVGANDASLASTAARTAAPVCVSKHGFFRFDWKCPKQPQFVPNNAQQVMTGEWCDTNISSSLGDYGYLKPYVTSAGSTTTTLSYYLVLDIEFRSRT